MILSEIHETEALSLKSSSAATITLLNQKDPSSSSVISVLCLVISVLALIFVFLGILYFIFKFLQKSTTLFQIPSFNTNPDLSSSSSPHWLSSITVFLYRESERSHSIAPYVSASSPILTSSGYFLFVATPRHVASLQLHLPSLQMITLNLKLRFLKLLLQRGDQYLHLVWSLAGRPRKSLCFEKALLSPQKKLQVNVMKSNVKLGWEFQEGVTPWGHSNISNATNIFVVALSSSPREARTGKTRLWWCREKIVCVYVKDMPLVRKEQETTHHSSV